MPSSNTTADLEILGDVNPVNSNILEISPRIPHQNAGRSPRDACYSAHHAQVTTTRRATTGCKPRNLRIARLYIRRRDRVWPHPPLFPTPRRDRRPCTNRTRPGTTRRDDGEAVLWHDGHRAQRVGERRRDYRDDSLWCASVASYVSAILTSRTGYDQGVFGGIIVTDSFLEEMGNPDSDLQGTIVSLYDIGWCA